MTDDCDRGSADDESPVRDHGGARDEAQLLGRQSGLRPPSGWLSQVDHIRTESDREPTRHPTQPTDTVAMTSSDRGSAAPLVRSVARR